MSQTSGLKVSHVIQDGNLIWTYFECGKSARSIRNNTDDIEHTYFDENEHVLSKDEFYKK